MIPQLDYNYTNEDEENESYFEEYTEPNLTYRLHGNKILGKCDGKEAVKQAIEKILNTEKYESYIYGWEYGIETKDLIGEDKYFVKSEITERIKTALSYDDRIKDIVDFEVEEIKKGLHIKFTAITTEGEIEQEAEFNV